MSEFLWDMLMLALAMLGMIGALIILRVLMDLTWMLIICKTDIKRKEY